MRALLAKRILQPAIARGMSSGAANAHSGPDLWKLGTYVFVPVWVIGTAVFVYQREMEHLAHHVRPEHKEYSHLGIRSKAFPWKDGNKSLFHNPKSNPLPGVGYEED